MNTALIFAGGTGQRMNSKSRPKQFLELHGKPIIIYTIEWFENSKEVDEIVIVCLEKWIDYLKELVNKYNLKKVKWIVKGGKTSQLSIFNGLEVIYKNCVNPKENIVLIHDGVRPLISEELIKENIESVKKYGSAVTITDAKETVIDIDSLNKINNISDRSICRIAKAPQSFYLDDIYKIHLKSFEEGIEDTVDSATLMNRYGYKLHVVEGPQENIKITTPIDYYVFRAICDAKENSQIFGFGGGN